MSNSAVENKIENIQIKKHSYYNHHLIELSENEVKDYLNKILVRLFNEAVEKGEMKLGSSLSTDDIRNYYTQKDYFSTMNQIIVFVAKQRKLFLEKEYVDYVYKKLKENHMLKDVYNKIDLQNYHYFLKPFFFEIQFEREEDILNDLYDEFVLNYGSKKKFANQINKDTITEIEGKKIEIKDNETQTYASEKRKIILNIVSNKLKKLHKTVDSGTNVVFKEKNDNKQEQNMENELIVKNHYTYHQYVKNFVAIIENLKTK